MTAAARRVAAATRQRPLTSRVRHIQQLTATIFCRLASSLLHHSANAGHCSRTAKASCSVAAGGCTGCHSVHREARSTPKGSLCRGQHACARTSRRICTPTSTLPSLRLACSRMRELLLRILNSHVFLRVWMLLVAAQAHIQQRSRDDRSVV
jgi:hypothetical protein